MSGTQAIILAAGRGSRLGEYTKDKPKCLTPLAGQPLIEWQIAAMRASGIERIILVTGYRAESLRGYSLDYVHNPDWARTNMVASLLAAADYLTVPTIVSYSDIVYGTDPVRALVSCEHELAVVYDERWRELWEARFEDPLSDAESFRMDQHGRLVEIGNRVRDIRDIEGQYMGLLRLTATSLSWIQDILRGDRDLIHSLDMTALLSRLIGAGYPVHGVATAGNWCEIDHPGDLLIAEERVAAGKLRLPAAKR